MRNWVFAVTEINNKLEWVWQKQPMTISSSWTQSQTMMPVSLVLKWPCDWGLPNKRETEMRYTTAKTGPWASTTCSPQRTLPFKLMGMLAHRVSLETLAEDDRTSSSLHDYWGRHPVQLFIWQIIMSAKLENKNVLCKSHAFVSVINLFLLI